MIAANVDDALIQFTGVSKRYRIGRERVNLRAALPGRIGERLGGTTREALAGIDFELRAGESLGIIGHNGAGKSTLLKLVARVVAPTSGQVRVRGRTAALIELGAGFHPDLTGRENVSFSAAVLGMSRRQLAARIDEIVDFAGIGAYLDTPVKRYSSGMLARLGFAVAAHLDAEVVVLDEVLAVGDAEFQRRCHERIRSLRSQGAALLYVTHALWSLPVLCTRAMLIERGHIVSAGTPDDVLAAYDRRTASVSDAAFTGHANVLSVAMRPETVAAGAEVTVDVEVEIMRPLPRGYAVLSLHSGTGDVIGAADLTADFGRPGRQRLAWRLRSLPLRPGEYHAYVTVVSSPTEPVVEHQRRVDFAVSGPRRPSDIYGHTWLPIETTTEAATIVGPDQA